MVFRRNTKINGGVNMFKNTDDLKPNPLNEKIYGNELPTEDFIVNIKLKGILEPLKIKTNGVIVSGHRRWRAAKSLNMEKVPVDIIEFENSLDEREAVIDFNRQRDKTFSQKMKEADELEKIEQERARQRQGTRTDIVENLPQCDKGKTRDKVAKKTGIGSGKTYDYAKKVWKEANQGNEYAAKLIKEIDEGKLAVSSAYKDVKKKQREEEIHKQRSEIAKSAENIKPSEKWNVWQADINTWQPPRQYDYIITDPPYPKEYLNLYETLAIKANDWLKDGGLLIAMCGQSYLNQIYEMMSKHITYYWTACYLTPGQPKPLRQVNVNTTWKPLLMFRKGQYKGRIFNDVFKSDGNDKSLHKWGQSESGMSDIISKVCLVGSWVADPFCGAGTTGVSALRNGCLFHGIDTDEQNIKITRRRLYDTTKR